MKPKKEASLLEANAFIRTLSKVIETKHDTKELSHLAYPNGAIDLDDNFLNLQWYIKGFSSKNIEQSRLYAKNTFREIHKLEAKIKVIYESVIIKDISKYTPHELTELNEEEEYYRSILTSIQDALSELIEHLVTFWPDSFTDDEDIKLIERYGSKFSRVIQEFLNNSEAETTKGKLSHPQIALLHIGKGLVLDSTNVNQIASNHGWTSKNSGQKILQHYNKLYTPKGRRDVESPKAIRDRIQLLKEMESYLKPDEYKIFQEDIKKLENFTK